MGIEYNQESLSFPSFFFLQVWDLTLTACTHLGSPGGAISKIPCDHVTGRLYSAGPVTLLQGLPVSPWGLTDAETPPGGRSELSAAHKQGDRPQTGWNQLDDADSQLPYHQAIRRMPTNWSHLPLWTHDDKTLCPFQVRTQFWGRSLLWSSLPGKVIKLFFSTS